jgi:uncharacterized protein YkwD
MKIKKYILPSRANNYHPHSIRPIGLAIVVALIASFNLTYNMASAHRTQVLGYATNISASEVISLTNQQRANNGLGALAYNAQLTQAAQAKAQDMLAKNYWSHYSPEGNGPAYFISASGYSYSTAGENLAKDFNTSSGVVNAWMGSTGHRANILNGNFIHTGVAVVNGTLQGSETTLVVAMYAAPNTPTPAPAPTSAPTPPPPQPVQNPAPGSTTAEVQSQEQATESEALPTTTDSESDKQNEQTAPTGTTAAPPPPTDQIAGQVQSAETSIIAREQLNWAQQVSLVLLSTVLLINVLKHTIVWRTNRRGWRDIWFRSHPAVQYALILVAVVSILGSSAGAIQ